MTNRITQIGNTGAKSFGEAETPVSRPAGETREPVILIHRSAPPPVASGDAATLDDCFEPLGVAAVRVMARFTLPRMSLVPIRVEEERPAPASEVSGRKTDHQD